MHTALKHENAEKPISEKAGTLSTISITGGFPLQFVVYISLHFELLRYVSVLSHTTIIILKK